MGHCPRASQCGIPENPGAAPSLHHKKEKRANPHLLTSLFHPPQISTSAPLTGPATTSASTPLGVSSASATRATRSMGSPTVEVGLTWGLSTQGTQKWGSPMAVPQGGWQCPTSPPCTPCWGRAGRAHVARRWCLQLQTQRQEQFATCLQGERERNPQHCWQRDGMWGGKGNIKRG